MFEKLPIEMKFSFAPKAAIYMPGRTVPTMIRGFGNITLSFESTDQPEVLSVSLRDARLRLVPFAFPIDVDQDGQLECIELTNMVLDRTFFDLKNSKGTLNLKTGDLELTFVYVATPQQVPLLDKLGSQTVRFPVTERGKMDLREGAFSLYSGVLEIKDGPLAGTWISGAGDTDCDPIPPVSTVELNVMIATPATRECGDEKRESVLICPGDMVLLCWTSSQDVVSVDLDPGGYTGLPATGIQVVTPVDPGPPAPPQVVYRVKTNGGHTPGTEDSVIAEFFRGGEESLGPYLAQPYKDPPRWEVEIDPRFVSGRIEVHEIQLVLDGCVDWSKFALEHRPSPPPAGPGGPVDFGTNIDNFNPLEVPEIARFPAGGFWKFTARSDPPRATPDPSQIEEPVCFTFKGECTLL